MSKINKEDIQTYILTTLLFGCISLPFISAFQTMKKEYDKRVVKTKTVNDLIQTDSLKIDSTSFYKHYLQNQRY